MTARPLRILGISGSLRQRSYNTALLRAAGEALSEGTVFEIAAISDLPLYNRDVEVEGLPEPVRRIRAHMSDADAVLFACPEYNWSITGALKNLIDWASRNPASPLDYKPAGIIGGGGRGGAARAQAHFREVLMHNRVQVLEDAEVLIPGIWDAFDDDLHLTDDRVRADVEIFIGAFEDHVRRDLSHRPAIVMLGSDPDVMGRAVRTLVADYRVAAAYSEDDALALVDRWDPAAVVIGGGVEAATRPSFTAAVSDVAPQAAMVEIGEEGIDTLPERLAAALRR